MLNYLKVFLISTMLIFVLIGCPAKLGTDGEQLNFGTTQVSMTFSISNIGTKGFMGIGGVDDLKYKVKSDSHWVSISPSTGVCKEKEENRITVTVNRNLLSDGINTCSLSITTNERNETIHVIVEKETNCSIELINPSISSNWNKGSSQTITWMSTGNCGNTVILELYKGGSWVGSIASTENDGSYIWNPVNDFDRGEASDYQIKVIDQSTGISDFSDNFRISIPPCTITVTSPKTGDNWNKGSSQTITWISTGNCGNTVILELYKGGSWVGSIASTENDGSYIWNPVKDIDRGEASDYQIKIIDQSTGESDFSDNFRISIPPCTITVSKPETGELLEVNTNYEIKWNSDGLCDDNVIIELYRNSSYYGSITNTPNNGSYIWNVNGALGSGYQIKILNQSSGESGLSGSFSIINSTCSINITQPSTGVIWDKGSLQTIVWNTSGNCDTNVVVELYKAGSWVGTIATTENDGSYTWNPVDDFGHGNAADYQIKILNPSTGDFDKSDYFRIKVTICTINVTNPSTGATWKVGDSKTITWTKTNGCGESVKIKLYKGLTFAGTINSDTQNDGFYIWRVETFGRGDGSDYRIKVTDLSSNSYDYSGYFTINEVIIDEELTPDPPSITNCASSGLINTQYTFTCSPVTSSFGHSVQYQFDWGDGTMSAWSSSNSSTHSWSLKGAKCVKVHARCATDNTIITSWSSCCYINIEDSPHTVSKPSIPTGPNSGDVGTSYTFNTGGASCIQGHPVEYRFDWGDGNYSTWGSSSRSHSWGVESNFCVEAEARCQVDHNIISAKSGCKWINIGVCEITVTNPNSTTVWKIDDGVKDVVTIRWDKGLLCGSSVKIELIFDGQAYLIDGSTSNDGTYYWEVDDFSNGTSSSYRIKITDLSTYKYDNSSYFSIQVLKTVYLEIDFATLTYISNFWSGTINLNFENAEVCNGGDCPSWYTCADGGLWLQGGGNFSETSRFWPSQSGSTGLVINPDADGLRVDQYYRDAEGNDNIELYVVTDRTSSCRIDFNPTITCTSKYAEFFSSLCFFDNFSPTIIYLVQEDHNTASDNDVIMKGIKYTFYGWKVAISKVYSGELESIDHKVE